MLKISKTAKISKYADIEESVRGTDIIIGDNVHIDSFVKIKPAGGMGDVIIGDNCYINPGVVIYSGNGVTLGNGVLIAANCTIAPVNHEFREKDKTIYDQRFKPSKGGIVIEDDVWIGANSVVLDGVVVRRGAVFGAHSVIQGEFEEYGVYAGSPLKLIKRRDD